VLTSDCCNVVDNGIQVLRVVVQLSRSDFRPNDVHIVAYDSKLRVVARQEVTSSGGVTSRREFTRELDVPRPVQRSTLRAVLEIGEAARLWIAASIMSSSSSSETAADVAVASVLPHDGQPCCVDLR